MRDIHFWVLMIGISVDLGFVWVRLLIDWTSYRQILIRKEEKLSYFFFTEFNYYHLCQFLVSDYFHHCVFMFCFWFEKFSWENRKCHRCCRWWWRWIRIESYYWNYLYPVCYVSFVVIVFGKMWIFFHFFCSLYFRHYLSIMFGK